MKNIAIERKFVKPSSISEYLKCPICLDVYRDAMRLYCGHTLCDQCLKDYMKDRDVCPECRTNIDVKNIGFDLLAREIINSFEVFCPEEECPWKGILQQLQNHINKQCLFADGNEKVKKIKKNEKIVWHASLDEQTIDKINQHTVKGSLEARIYLKNDSLKDVLLKESSSSNKPSLGNTEPKARKGRKAKNQTVTAVAKQTRTSSFDFLSSLFD